MKRNQLMRGTLAVALAAGLIAAGCGDDDDDGDEAASLTKDEWIAQADEICAAGNEEIDAEADEVFSQGEPKPEEIERFTEEVAVPNIEQQVAGVKALGAPEGDEAEVEAIITAAEDGIEQARQDPASLEQGALDEATQLMADYGSKVCGEE